MSALAHCFEGDGLATVIVALVREHVVAMRPPRALWVPFELGRPFAAPKRADLQRRILGEALAMLDLGPGPLLNEFDAPESRSADDPDWRPPVGLDRRSLEAEARQVAEIWSALVQRNGRTTVGISGFSPPQAVAFVDRYLDPEPIPNPKGMARVSRARFAIDDIKACYLEAATAGDDNPSSRQLHDWFWEQSLAGAMIKRFQDRARHSEDANLRLISGSLVPAERTLSFTR